MRGTSVRREGGGRYGGQARWVRAATLAVVLVASGLARLPTFRIPLDQDGSVFAYVAKVWSEGGVPYRDVWDHKPPLIYLAYRGLFFFTPPEGSDVNATLRLGSLVCDLATVALLVAFCWRVFDFWRAALAGLLYGVFTAAPGLQDEAFQPERLTTLFTVAALLAAAAYARGRRLWLSGLSGLLFGLALLTKQVAAPVGALAWAWVSCEAFRSEGRGALRRVVLHSVLMAAGAVLPWVVCFAYFAARGAFGDFWECVFTYNLFYAAAERKGSLVAGVSTFVRHGLFDHAFLWLGGVLGMVAALASERTRAGGLLVVLWAAGAALGLILPGQFAAYYYIPTVAPFAAASAVGLGWVYGLVRSGKALWLRATVGLATVVVLGACLFVAAKRAYAPDGRYEFATDPKRTNALVAEVARYIKEHSRAGDYVYMRGGRMQVYILSGRRNPTRFMYDFYYGLPPEKAYHYKPEKLREIMSALEERRPLYILVTTRGVGKDTFDGAFESLDRYFPAFKRFLERHYAPERVWEGRPVSLVLYRMKGT